MLKFNIFPNSKNSICSRKKKKWIPTCKTGKLDPFSAFHSLWSLLSVQMFIWWICMGESGLPILFLCHLSSSCISFLNPSSSHCSEVCSVISNFFFFFLDCSLPGSSVHGILQGRTLKWVVIPFSRGFSQLRGQTQVSSIAGRFCTIYHRSN